MAYTIALAGNPNSGKTTLFNELTGARQHVGNWPGVTVDKKEGIYRKNKDIKVLDLPGIYSLSPYTAEEVIARDFIVKDKPDVVINIVDGTNIERNLYLTLQIAETKIPMVVAINMMDEVEAQGDRIDCDELAKRLGVAVVPIVARSGKGLTEIMDAAVEAAQKNIVAKDLDIFDDNIHSAINPIYEILAEGEASNRTPTTSDSAEQRWQAIKLVENDEIIMETLSESQKAAVQKIVEKAEKNANGDLEARIADLRYQFIDKLVKAAIHKSKKGHIETTSDKLDKILTNRVLALPIFAVVMFLLFAITFSENFLFIQGLLSPGMWLAGLVEELWAIFASGVANLISNASPMLQSLVVDGILEGIGSIVGFIPLVWVLYILISFLEDCGYMARIAFVMDRIFRRFGLSGRSFIPLLMGFGCSVPAIMATRTLDSEKDRRITTIITGFMPCGAKLPIFAMFVAAFFADDNMTLVTYSLYMLSIVVAIIVSLLLNKFIFKSEGTNFLMELPRYRVPTLKSIAIHGWEKVKGFAVKAGTVIFISTIILWALTSFNINSFNGVNAANNDDGSIMCEMDDSFLASVGSVVAPVFKPLGFGEWRPTVGIATGWIAKEMVVVSMAQLYDADISPEGVIAEGEEGRGLVSLKDDIKTKEAAYAYMVFNLLCMPCFAAVGAMKRELKSWKQTSMAIGVQMATAYVVGFIVYTIGSLIA